MADPPSVKEFAQALCLLSAEIGVTEEMKVVYETLKCPSNMSEIVPIVSKFCTAFFDPITKHIALFAEQFKESEQRFLEFMIPRCLILCDAPEPFYFILTCSFVIEIIYQLIDQLGCYRFVTTASKCLRAIIERKFKFFFEDKNAWKKLCSFCKNVMDKFYTAKKVTCLVNFLLPSKGKLKGYILSLISECNALTWHQTLLKKLVLSDYERALLSEEDIIEINSGRSTKRIKTKSFNAYPEINYSVLDSVKNDKVLKVESTPKFSDQFSEITDGVLDLSTKNRSENITRESTLESTNGQSLFHVPTTIAELIIPDTKINSTELVATNDSSGTKISKTTAELSFEEQYANCTFENHEEYKKKVIYAESLEQDPGRYLHGPNFTKLHENVCPFCELKCFKFLVFCIERHRNRYGDDGTIADAWLELYSDE